MKKIMFDDQHGLTKAVLEGRKTMTRRIISREKYPLLYSWQQNRLRFEILGNDTLRVWYKAEPQSLRTVDHFDIRIPLHIGEVVAVAQAYKDTCWTSPVLRLKDKPGWSNKMFVYAGLMPHQIRITNVRVERLQDISDEDCLREGIYKKTLCPPGDIDYFYHSEPRSKWEVYPSARDAFAGLIDKVSGKGTWASNPWVFVYEFELVK